MSRLVSAPFFSAHPVFDRAEYAAAVGRDPSDKVVTAMLAQHLQAGNIKRVARGVFASVPKHADARKWSVDRFLAASRLRRGAVIAYHSALELHGSAYTEGYEVQVIAPGEPSVLDAAGFSCRFVKPPRGFARRDGELKDGVMVVDRMGPAGFWMGFIIGLTSAAIMMMLRMRFLQRQSSSVILQRAAR